MRFREKMRNHHVAIAALSLVSAASAQSCWQDTTCSGPTEASFPGPWDSYIYAPASRVVSPASVFPLDDVAKVSIYPHIPTIKGNASALVFDFGKEVGGNPTIKFATTGSGRLGLAYTEAKNWIGLASDSSNGAFSRGVGDQACDDGAIYGNFSSAGHHSFTPDIKYLRGGFRYLTLFLLTNHTSTSIRITSVKLEIAYAPTWPNLRAYQGYWMSNDEQLNKIWYSGAYTLQTNAVPINTGRQIPPLATGWANNGTLSNGTTVIVDGAKRDRAVWPGDMGIAVPSAFVSFSGADGLDSVKNALQTMYDHQNSNGMFPEAGPPLLQQGSDTYHCWTMIGTYNYVLFTNDTTFLLDNWQGYQRAMDYIYSLVLQPLGLMNSTGLRDWARLQTGGNNTEANMILYKTLTTGSALATWAGNKRLSSLYRDRAETLASNIIKHTYDSTYGAFKDNNTQTTLHPQDANSMSLVFGVVANNSAMAQSISERLTDNWTPIGANAPELPNNVSPFISGFEVQGHFTVGNPERALDLIRRSWGWYLDNKNGTESTVIEGYLTNGSFAYRNYRGYAYDASYPSHSHGWSSGPTSALTNYVLGLSITDRAGSSWKLAPMFAGLTSVEGGFTTGLGKFQANWKVSNGGEAYTLEWSVPEHTAGEVLLPSLPAGHLGKVTWNRKGQGTIAPGRTKKMTTGGGKQSVSVTRA